MGRKITREKRPRGTLEQTEIFNFNLFALLCYSTPIALSPNILILLCQ
jgi:hypothetical protein